MGRSTGGGSGKVIGETYRVAPQVLGIQPDDELAKVASLEHANERVLDQSEHLPKG